MFDSDIKSRIDSRIVRATADTPKEEAEALLSVLDKVINRDDQTKKSDQPR